MSPPSRQLKTAPDLPHGALVGLDSGTEPGSALAGGWALGPFSP